MLLTFEFSSRKISFLPNEQRGYFRFGNPDAPFVLVRQAIRGMMWARMDNPEENGLKRISQVHEHLDMQRQSIDIFRLRSAI